MKYFSIIFFILALALGSCKDACKEVDCQHGVCNEGECSCEAGWSKDANGSCTIQDKCYGVSCGAHGTCNAADGSCTCETGYEGDDCAVVSRLKFLNSGGSFASFFAYETGSASGTAQYILTISPSSAAIDKVLISNAWAAFVHDVVATVNGNTITIARQQPDSDGYFIEGSGTISGNVVSVTYQVTTPSGEIDIVTGTWTKQ